MPLIKGTIVSCGVDKESIEELLDKYDIDYDYFEINDDNSQIEIYCDDDNIEKVSKLLTQLWYKVLYC